MKIPPIDLSKFLHLLKSEGRAEMSITSAPKFGELTRGIKPNNLALFKEWDNIILILEKEVIPLLSKGCEAKSLVGSAQKLAKSAGALSLIASEVLSFVPGPVGIVCSLINAIVCFSTGNIVGGLFELLGCIPGGKVAGKGASKLFPKIEKILIEMIQSNHQLCVIVETASKQQKVVVEFFEKYAPKAKPKPKAEVGYGYGVRTEMNPTKTGNMPSLEEAIKINMGRETRTHIPTNKNYYYPESTNSMIYRLGTNTGKSILW